MASLLYLFSGINLGVALIVFLIAWKSNRDQSYFLFGIFSLFSGLYFLTSGITGLQTLAILFAGIYYSTFVLFVSHFANIKKPFVSATLVILFSIAVIMHAFNPSGREWQLVAHVGLLGIVILLLFSSYRLYTNQGRKSLDFWIVSILFSLLALEEISTFEFNAPLFSNLTEFPPLDLFPFLFTLIIGKRMAFEIFQKSQLELKLVQSQLRDEKLKLQESERKRLESELSFKQKDLTDFGLEISRNRDFLKKLGNQLLEMKNETSANLAQTANASIKSYLSNNKSAALLQENVNEVNHEFIQNLKSRFPKLSQNEIQICLLLRLQLSSKEIASIKHISSDSLKVLRYRLRKKLALSSDVNLAEFIQSL